MKCPYRIDTITTLTDEMLLKKEQVFAECIRLECPMFYQTQASSGAILLPHCARADKEVEDALRGGDEE